MKSLILFLLLFPSIALAVDDATVQAIDSKASNANSKADGNNSRIQALEAEDVLLHNRIDSIQLTPGPKGDTGAQGSKGDTGATGPQGLKGDTGAAGAQGLKGGKGDTGPAGSNGVDGKSCTAIQGTDSATISCEDGTIASVYNGTGGATVIGNTAGDMQYWDGSAWVLIAAPSDGTTVGSTGLNFCKGVPTWGLCTYQIGDTGPAGGIVFYVTDGGLHGLEAAPRDLVPTRWGCFGTQLSVATNGAVVGTGAANTAAIVAECNEGVSTAANFADAYTRNGYGDWFLPSIDELKLLYLQKSIVGDFTSDFYWSSSQIDSSFAWELEFHSGLQGNYNKGLQNGVRVVRAF